MSWFVRDLIFAIGSELFNGMLETEIWSKTMERHNTSLVLATEYVGCWWWRSLEFQQVPLQVC